MSPTIRISQDTYEHLQEQAEPFTDTPDSVIRRVLGLDIEDHAGDVAEDAAPPADAQAARTEREAPGAAAATTNGSGEPKGKSRRSATNSRATKSRGSRHTAAKRGARAPRGSLMHEEAYELPILQTLAERGGRAGKNEVLDALEPRLGDKLTELDRSQISSGEIRWRNRAQFVRLRLVERGDMERGSPRGIWELAEQGRARVQDSGAPDEAAGTR